MCIRDSAGHVHGVESYLRPGGCLIRAGHHKFVFVGELPRHHQRGVIQLAVDVFLGHCRVVDFLKKMLAERFRHRENHLAVGGCDGVILNEVEEAVGVAPVSYTHLDVYKRQTRHRQPIEI